MRSDGSCDGLGQLTLVEAPPADPDVADAFQLAHTPEEVGVGHDKAPELAWIQWQVLIQEHSRQALRRVAMTVVRRMRGPRLLRLRPWIVNVAGRCLLAHLPQRRVSP
jgi:hypothetical protein